MDPEMGSKPQQNRRSTGQKRAYWIHAEYDLATGITPAEPLTSDLTLLICFGFVWNSLHVAAGSVFVLPAAVRGSGAGRGEDGGEPVEVRAGLDGEPDFGGPHCPAELGGRGVAGDDERPAGDGPGPDPGTTGVWRETGTWCGRR